LGLELLKERSKVGLAFRSLTELFSGAISLAGFCEIQIVFPDSFLFQQNGDLSCLVSPQLDSPNILKDSLKAANESRTNAWSVVVHDERRESPSRARHHERHTS
jgi:hypothetical protein